MAESKQKQIQQYEEDLRHVELTGEPAEILRTYQKFCDELQEAKERVDTWKPKAVEVLRKYGTPTNNPSVKEGNDQLGVMVRFNNKVVCFTLTTTPGIRVPKWDEVAEALAKRCGVKDIRQFAENLGLVSQRKGTTTLKANASGLARKAIGDK